MITTKSYISFANKLNDFCGKSFAWLTLAMVLITISIVLSKFFFNTSSIQIEESVTYMFGMMFMVGVAYTLRHDNHVRVDIFYSKMSKRSKAWVDIFGTVVFLLPFCLFVLWFSFGPVIDSWGVEGAKDTGGIPAIYVLRAFLLVMPVLLAIQGLANILTNLETIKHEDTKQQETNQ